MKQFYTYTVFLFFAIFPKLLEAQATGDFRSRASGTWATATNWETFNGSAWVVAAAAPTSGTANVINILNSHTIQVAANVNVDQVIVDAGGTINWTNGTFTINAGVGIDLTINGTFIDNRGVAGTSIAFIAGATWQMGANGTLIRTSGNSSNNWQNAYEGGISNIPSTSNWILRKTGTQNPSISSLGAFYPNLIIENNTGANWNTATASTFQGNSNFPTIKGNLDIGGAGTSTVTFYNDNTFATPTLVLGNMTIRNGSTYNNNGTGTELRGNLTVAGTLAYDANDTRRWIFSGANAQNISGAGTFNVYQMIVNKTANDVTLSKAITIDNNLTLTFGKLISSATNLLTIADPATVTVSSPTTNNSFVSGPIRKINTSAGFSFPVGKGNNFQPLSVNAHVGGSAITIYSENFNSGAPGWTLNVVTGAEGADANFWVINDNEGGVLPPGCGVAGNGNPTLHVTSVFFPAGGAAYDAGGLCGFLFCPQADRRSESPVINCSGQSGIFVGFNYIEGGATTFDNATLWYFDGATWSQIDDMPKTATGCGGQGIWTNRQVALPASANNNPNVRIAFRWVNNDDGAGTDPSFAVDDVSLFVPAALDAFTAEYFQANAVGTYGAAKEATIDQIVTNEYWVLDRNAGAANKQVTLSWDQTSSVTDAAATKVVRWDGAIWRDHFNGGTIGVNANDPSCTTQATCGTLTTSLIVSSFSPFTFATPIVLPITLQRFDAIKVATKAQLDWTTASEENLAYFEIERSHDGLHFESLGRVQAVGNSHREQAYQYTDVQPFVGDNYYRFKAVDNDESFSYSPVRVLNFEKAATPVSIMPNPVEDVLRIQLTQEASSLRIELFALDGRLICTRFVHVQNNYEFDMRSMSAGFYFLRLTIDGDTQTLKVEKK